MGKKSKQVDAYIANSPDWAQPILTSLRATVHDACPGVEETLKWRHPTFMYHGIMCGMIQFKEYCALHFWKAELVTGKPIRGGPGAAAEQFGKLTSVKDLPSRKVITAFVKKAMTLNEGGISAPKRPTKTKRPLAIPTYLMSLIRKNKKALVWFKAFSPSHQREYIQWITEAKGEDTRDRRVAQAIAWMAEGKPRNWKYM